MLMYGRSAHSIAEQIGGTDEEAQAIINSFYEGFPAVKTWMDKTYEGVRKYGYVEDFWGRRRRLPDYNLPPYEVYDKDYKSDSNFNPILGCKGLVTKQKNPLIQKYEEMIKGARNNTQKEKIKKEALQNGVTILDNGGYIAQAERQCVNARVQGCLSFDTIILTKNGPEKIGNLSNQFVEVWDGNGWTTAQVLPSGKKKKCVLTTNLGTQIVCSPDHKFFTINSRGTEKFKKLSELKKQDRLIISDDLPFWNYSSKLRDLFPQDYTTCYNKHNYSFDDIQNSYERGLVLGRIASDGSYFNKPTDDGGTIYLFIAEHEKEELEFFKKILPYQYTIKETQKKNQKLYQITISSKTLYNECTFLDLKHQIPPYLYTDSELLRGFISGMFDGDGTASCNSVSLCFGKQYDFTTMINQVRDALIMFGIRSTSHEFSNCYRVRVRKQDIAKFVDRIGFINSIKNTLAGQIHTIHDNHVFNGKSTVNISNIELTDEEIDMFDVCNTEHGYFVANGLVTHNSSASLTKLAMIKIYNDPKMKEWDAHLIIGVHDELLMECKEEFAQEVADQLSYDMISAASDNGVDIPMKCDAEIFTWWYQDQIIGDIQDEVDALLKAETISKEDAISKVLAENYSFLTESQVLAFSQEIK